MRRFISLPIFFLLPFFAATQPTHPLDSLLKQLNFAKEDTGKIKLLLGIQQEFFLANEFDSALFYNGQCENLISKIHAQQYEHTCLHSFVRIYHAQASYRPALNYCLRAITVAKQSKN